MIKTSGWMPGTQTGMREPDPRSGYGGAIYHGMQKVTGNPADSCGGTSYLLLY
ncbi:MAG: hypothetical protein LBJ24_05825 [Treponema sp.]|nr:hypothetical protein [Treponema sp.]